MPRSHSSPSANGNAGEYAAPGTVFWKDGAATYGRLLVDNGQDATTHADRKGPLTPLPALGTAGLSNSGEPLALIDGAGDAVSALPAVATSSGESLRRRHTYSPDDDASAFSTGAPSPGAPND